MGTAGGGQFQYRRYTGAASKQSLAPSRCAGKDSAGGEARAIQCAQPCHSGGEGRYLLFVDDDETPDPEWLVAYEKAMLNFAPDALGGRIEVLFEHGVRPSWLQNDLLGFLGLLDHGEEQWLTDPATPFYGGNFAVRKEIFLGLVCLIVISGVRGGSMLEVRIPNSTAVLSRRATASVGFPGQSLIIASLSRNCAEAIFLNCIIGRAWRRECVSVALTSAYHRYTCSGSWFAP